MRKIIIIKKGNEINKQNKFKKKQKERRLIDHCAVKGREPVS